MPSKATTVQQYLDDLTPERRSEVARVRELILSNLDPAIKEGIQYGMIGYFVPHSVYPPGYHVDPKQPLPFAALASQKNHIALYLMTVYADAEEEAWLRERWEGTGKKLDMGRSCVRFKKADDLALDVLGEAIRRVRATRHIAHYEASIGDRAKKKAPAKKSAPVKKKAPAKRPRR